MNCQFTKLLISECLGVNSDAARTRASTADHVGPMTFNTPGGLTVHVSKGKHFLV